MEKARDFQAAAAAGSTPDKLGEEWQKAVLYPGSCKHLELILPRDGREANRNGFNEGFDHFRAGRAE